MSLAAILWHAPQVAGLAIAVAAAVGAATLWLYLPQVRSLRRPWRYALPALRSAAMAALAISLVKPVAVLPASDAEIPAAVAVVIDHSASMDIADNGRTPAEQVALADGLGLLPQGVRDAAAAALRREIDAASQLVEALARGEAERRYAKVAGRGAAEAEARTERAIEALRDAVRALSSRGGAGQPPVLRERLGRLNELLATPAEMLVAQSRVRLSGIAEALAESQAGTDGDLYRTNPQVRAVCDALIGQSRVELALAGLGGERGAIARLPKQTAAFTFGFAEQLFPMPQALSQPTPSTRPAGAGSDIVGAVAAAEQRMTGHPLRAIVLVSDGRQVGGRPLSAALAPPGVPVFAVAAASTSPGHDVAIARVTLPGSGFVGEKVTVLAELRASGLAGQTVPVHLRVDDKIAQTQAVTFGDGPTTSVEFTFKLKEAGPKAVTVEIDPLSGELSTTNNAATRWIKALKDKVAVAAFSGSGGWDHQYIRNALARAQWVKLTEVILRPGAMLHATPEALLEQDVIVLSDVGVNSLNRAQWDAVHRCVTERGGSVILVAGPDHVPSALAKDPLLASLLPYRPEFAPTWRTSPGREPAVRLKSVASGPGQEFLRLGDSSAADDRDWTALPAIYRYLSPAELKPNTRALLVERDGGLPVLTESRLGAGRAFFLGINETWRWRRNVGERDQDRFWLQLVRYAGDEPYAVQDGQRFLDADRVAAGPGQPVRVRAKRLGRDGVPISAESQTLRIVGPGGAIVRELQMTKVGAERSGRFEAIVNDLPEGAYELQLPGASPSDAGPLALTLKIAESGEAELADLSGDESLLRRLAEGSGGQLLALAELNSLPQRLAAADRAREAKVRELSLWDSPHLFLFVLACLGGEWAMRKRLGLA